MKVQKEKERDEQAERQAIIEQERRDREIALRLAAEDQNQVEDVTLPPLVRYDLTTVQPVCTDHNLEWKNVAIVDMWSYIVG